MGWSSDVSRGLPQKEQAARARETGCWQVLCTRGGAVVRKTSTVANSFTGSLPSACFGRAHYAVTLCTTAMHGPTSEAHRASGRRHSSSPSLTLLTAPLGRTAPLHWHACAARYRFVMIVFLRAARETRVGRVSGGDSHELHSSPQNFSGTKQYRYVIVMTPVKYLPQDFNSPPLELEICIPNYVT